MLYILCHYHLLFQSIPSICTSLRIAILFCVIQANSLRQNFFLCHLEYPAPHFLFIIRFFFYLFPPGCSSFYILGLSLFIPFFILVMLFLACPSVHFHFHPASLIKKLLHGSIVRFCINPSFLFI